MLDRYILVTPARNEEAFIGNTIEAVLAQTVLPQKWQIVSDRSVDRTDEIVRGYARKHKFIQFLRTEGQAGLANRDFGSKVMAFRAGHRQISDIHHHFIGNLDADITFAPKYFEQLLERFRENERLGVAGGIVLEPKGDTYVPQMTSLNSVCGSVQLFRKECYDAFGGYIPIRGGGVDAAAEIMARMHGWSVETFRDLPVYAQRPVKTGGATVFHTCYRQGISNCLLGYHPLFQLASSISRIGQRPFVAGSVATMLGYTLSYLRRDQKVLPSDVIGFLRAEQMDRLLSSIGARRQSVRA